MRQVFLTRNALLGTACAFLALAASVPANAQSYPPGTNCQSLLPALRTGCLEQAQQMNSGTNNNNTMIPNSAGGNTVPTPGTVDPNSINTGTPGVPGTPNGGVTPNGVVNPNSVQQNGTISPNTVTPNGTVNPNAVGTPNQAPATNPVLVPPAGAGTTTGSGTTGTTGTTGN